MGTRLFQRLVRAANEVVHACTDGMDFAPVAIAKAERASVRIARIKAQELILGFGRPRRRNLIFDAAARNPACLRVTDRSTTRYTDSSIRCAATQASFDAAISETARPIDKRPVKGITEPC